MRIGKLQSRPPKYSDSYNIALIDNDPKLDVFLIADIARTMEKPQGQTTVLFG